MTSHSGGWVAHTPEHPREHDEARGALLGIVEVRVYEHAEESQVSFPPGAVLGPGSDPAHIADVVERARDELARWR